MICSVITACRQTSTTGHLPRPASEPRRSAQQKSASSSPQIFPPLQARFCRKLTLNMHRKSGSRPRTFHRTTAVRQIRGAGFPALANLPPTQRIKTKERGKILESGTPLRRKFAKKTCLSINAVLYAKAPSRHLPFVYVCVAFYLDPAEQKRATVIPSGDCDSGHEFASCPYLRCREGTLSRKEPDSSYLALCFE